MNLSCCSVNDEKVRWLKRASETICEDGKEKESCGKRWGRHGVRMDLWVNQGKMDTWTNNVGRRCIAGPEEVGLDIICYYGKMKSRCLGGAVVAVPVEIDDQEQPCYSSERDVVFSSLYFSFHCTSFLYTLLTFALPSHSSYNYLTYTISVNYKTFYRKCNPPESNIKNSLMYSVFIKTIYI